MLHRHSPSLLQGAQHWAKPKVLIASTSQHNFFYIFFPLLDCFLFFKNSPFSLAPLEHISYVISLKVTRFNQLDLITSYILCIFFVMLIRTSLFLLLMLFHGHLPVGWWVLTVRRRCIHLCISNTYHRTGKYGHQKNVSETGMKELYRCWKHVIADHDIFHSNSKVNENRADFLRCLKSYPKKF